MSLRERLAARTSVTAGILLIAATLSAQEVTLAGKITDSTDAVLPGVAVIALHVDTGNTFAAVTDGMGSYRIGAMRTGVYKVTAELAGFATVIRDNLELAVGQAAVLNLRMALTSVQESVTVTGSAPLIDTTRSNLGTRVEPRQVQELPINGRNWMQLAILAPGSRQTAVGDAPVSGAQGTDPGIYQLNMDGQQVTQTMAQSTFGQPRFSQDAIAEFQYVSSRFDATQGRSSGVQVNAISKSGTNTFSGSASGTFRDDKLNAPDFVLHRVLPASDQLYSGTFGGPIERDVLHFFVNYQGERTPRTTAFNSALYPRFNVPDMLAVNTEHIVGLRFDWQAKGNTRLMLRGNAWIKDNPITSSGSVVSSHPSTLQGQYWRHYELFIPLTTVIGSKATNEFKPGFLYHTSDAEGIVPHSPRVAVRGYTFGNSSNNPLRLILHTYTVRDDFTTVLNRHEIKIGGEYLWQPSHYEWNTLRYGSLDATRGAPPANLQDLFPVWDDFSTWNLAPLSANSVRYQQSIGNWSWGHNQPNVAAYIQDNWAVRPHLTLNVGIRWDLAWNWAGNNFDYEPLRHKVDNEFANFGPRLGFAYTLPGERTVLRGGYGQYFIGPKDQWAHHIPINQQIGIPSVLYDGRADFAVNPFNGPPPSFTAAKAAVQDVTGWIASDTDRMPYSHQASIGVQRQLGEAMSFQADFVWVGGRRNEQFFNTNLTYDPVTGVNNPWTDITKRRWSNFGTTNQVFSLRDSNYRGLETLFSKRFSHRWQASVAYTLAGTWDRDPSPVFDEFPVQPDLGGEYGLAGGDYRHRLVSNAIWSLPLDFQLSGVVTYRSGSRSQETYGQDLRNRGTASGRLRPDGTIIPRNAFVGDDLFTTDLKIVKRLTLSGRRQLEGSIELFNTFNQPTYAYVLNQAAANYLQRSSGSSPRAAQLGIRYRF